MSHENAINEHYIKEERKIMPQALIINQFSALLEFFNKTLLLK